MKDDLVMVLVTFPSEEAVRQIGTYLLGKQLIACINIVPQVKSMYLWQGEMCEEAEFLAVMKTVRENIKEVESLILEKHPYDVPEFIVIEPQHVSESYHRWVKSACFLKKI